ncbi:MAG: hypothetical protein K9L87_03315 [Candidatus Omnitrophica bacterium]|nr:hypothetical protein [Candidatus Omnitrophota bacterium]MCF7897760.1 hypothetical protein [Candidatus Omnitrophota bacterium]MCF7909214.1 hypothetical protein [Candidatus Omnitrophota bacterium]
MKKSFFCLIGLMLAAMIFSGNCFALEIGNQKVEITASQTYVSRYIWRGQDLYGNNDGAYQPSLDISLPKLIYDTDLAFNVWGSFPLSAGHQDGEELDYTITLSKEIYKDLNLSLGYTYFDFPNASSDSDVQEPWISLSLAKIPGLGIDISFDLFAGYDFKAASGGPDEGWYYSWGLGTEIPLPHLVLFQEGQTLSLAVVNWGNDGVADLEPNSLYATELSLSTSYAFGKFSISPSFNYTINHEEKINNGDEEVWGGVEVSYAF